MKPAPFVYHAPESLDEAVAALAEHGDDAKVLAGGQSLVPVMNMRLARPSVLVDIGGVPGMDAIEANGVLRIGATAKQAAVLQDAAVAEAAPLIPAALSHVGHEANRNRGTFGGSIAHADPAAELPAVLLALRGEVVAHGSAGERVIAADDFFITYLTTELAMDEVVVEVRVPPPSAGLHRRWAFLEVARRHGDFALAGVALVADCRADGVVESASVALLGVSDVPVRARAAEEALVGARLDDVGRIAEASALAAEGLEPPGDVHASATYRRRAVTVLARRALEQAANRTEGNT